VTVLVTGAAGFLGSRLVRKLIALGYSIKAIGRCSVPREFESANNLVWIERDIAIDGIRQEEIADIDTVFHIAGTTSGTDEWQYFMENESTTVKLLQACSKLAKKIIFASSQMVYGDVNHTAVSEGFSLQSPGFAYGCSKINSENWLRYFQKEHGGLCLALRFTGFVEGGGLIDYIIDRALRNEPVELFSQGTVCRDYLSVDKGVDAFLSALCYEKNDSFEVFNIGSGKVLSSHHLATMVFAELNSSSDVVLSSFPARMRNFGFDIRKAVEQLNFNPGDLSESIREYVSQKKTAFEKGKGSEKN
jgi:UDP-glucose 4-epimerase